MLTFIIIISSLLWIASFAALFRKILLAPALSYLALLTLSFASSDGYPLIPVNATILWGWLAMTIVVMVATILQSDAINRSSRGIPYMFVGGIAGMSVGLLGYTVTFDISLLYGIMIACTVAGILLGFLLYTNTPDGRNLRPGSGMFVKYLSAKGFTVAISIMQLGVALVITLAMHNIGSL